MREAISIHLGQAGSQVGNACWELYCLVSVSEWCVGSVLACVCAAACLHLPIMLCVYVNVCR